MNAARHAIEQLASWPDLSSAPASCGTGTAVRSGTREIVHFHSDHDADLHLTARAAARMGDELEHCTAVRLHPGSEWVTVHLDCVGDAELLVGLVSVALKAHAATPLAAVPPADVRCNLVRIDILPARQFAPGRVTARRFARGRGRTA